MRFLNPPHEPTSLVISRFLFLVIGAAGLIFFIVKQFSDLLELKDTYQIEYHTETIVMPTLLFRTIVASNIDIQYGAGINTKSDFKLYDQSEIKNVFDIVKWKENVTDANYLIQDWKSLGVKQISPSLNNSALDMVMIKPNINLTFVPARRSNFKSPNSGKVPIVDFVMWIIMQPRTDASSAALQLSNFQTDIFVINNPDLLDPTKYGRPLELARIPSKDRFTVKGGSNINIDFLKTYKKKNQTETVYDFGFYDQQAADSTVIGINITPRNEPAEDSDAFTVKEEISRRPVGLFQVFGATGGAISIFIFIFIILFGQCRLRPWGIIQRYIMRNRMLSILPPSMVSIKSHYNPGSNQESATDMTFINMPNSEQRGTASWQPKPVDNRSYQHEPLDDAISQRIPSIFINDENKQSYAVADARASEIRELKAMMAAQKTQIQEQQAQMETQKNRMEAQMVTQMRQLAMMSNQLAVLEGDTNTNNSAIMLNKPTPDKTCLASTSINQYSKAILSSDISSSLEARVSNIEAFQYRLETFYLSSDLFKDNSFN